MAIKLRSIDMKSSVGSNKSLQLPEVAAASLPDATIREGHIVYDATNNVVSFSDGTNWAAISAVAALTLDGAFDNGKIINAAADAATSVQIGGAAANDKIQMWHNATDAHIATGAGDLHLEPAGGDVVVTGDVECSAKVQGATVVSTGLATLNSCSVTGAFSAGSFAVDAIASSTAGSNLHLDGNAAGGVHICETSTGGITLGDDVSVAAAKTVTLAGAVHSDVFLLTAGDIALADGRISITDNDNAASFVLTNDTFTNGASGLVDINAGGVITGNIVSVVADALTSGTMVYLESSAAGMVGKYIQCFDGAADDFSVGLYGATIIAGNAVGTAALTVSAGDLKLTAGVIDQDIVTDHANVFTRAQATTTKDFVQILCTDASDDHSALYVKHDGTGAVPALEVLSAGSDSAAVLTCSAAAGSALTCVNSAAGTDSIVKIDGATGHWVGAANVGMVNLASDGTPADVAASCLRIALSGVGILLGEGNCLRVVDTSAAATSHSVYISSTNNEALWVDVGKARFDEGILVGSGATGYVSSLGAQDLVLRTNEGTDSGTITIADGVAGNITITPNTVGRVAITGPARADGTVFHGIPQIVGMPFVAGSFTAQDDLVLFNAAAPKCVILDFWVNYATEEAITLILRDAVNGGGNVKAEAIDITAAGPECGRTDGISAPTVAAGNSLVVHASGNPAAAVGTVYVLYMEVA